MAISFKKTPVKNAPVENIKIPEEVPHQTLVPKTSMSEGNTPSWLKKGKQAEEARDAHKKYVEEAKKAAAGEALENSKPRRFFLPKESKTTVTVIDGAGEGGTLDPVMVYEHQYKKDGKWGNFAVCTLESEGECPLCVSAEEGDNVSRRALTAFFSIVDHTIWTSKTGKEYKDQLKVLAMKPQSFESLSQVLDIQETPVAGTTFAVARSGDDKSVAVGNTWVPKSTASVGEICNKYEVTPVDWEQYFTYKTADELRSEGFGGGPSVNQQFSGGDSTPFSTLEDEI